MDSKIKDTTSNILETTTSTEQEKSVEVVSVKGNSQNDEVETTESETTEVETTEVETTEVETTEPETTEPETTEPETTEVEESEVETTESEESELATTKLSKKEKKKLKKAKKKKAKTKKKKKKVSIKEKVKAVKGNISDGIKNIKRRLKAFGKFIFKVVVILTLVLLLSNLALQTYFNRTQELNIITLYEDSTISSLLESYGNNLFNKSRVFYEVKDPEFYKLLADKPEQASNFNSATKIQLNSKVYGVKDSNYYIGTVVKIDSPVEKARSFKQYKNLFGRNEDLYYSLIEINKDSLKVVKEYSVYIDSYTQRIFKKEAHGISQDLASEYGLKKLGEKYSIKFSDIYQNLKLDNLVESLDNTLVLDVLTEDTVISDKKEISDREVELIEASLYKEVNSLGDNYGVSKASENEVSQKIKSIIDSLKLPRKEFGSFYALIKNGGFRDGAYTQFIPQANLLQKIKYKLPFTTKEPQLAYQNFLIKFEGAYLADYEIYSNTEELYVFLNYRKELSDMPITTTVFITFDKETGVLSYLNEKSSKLQFALDESKTRDAILLEKRDLLLTHLLNRVNLYQTDNIKGGKLSSYKFNFLNDKDFITTIFNSESLEEVLLRSEITSTSLTLEFTKKDLVSLIYLIENYENKKFQGELSEILRSANIGSIEQLQENLFHQFDIMIIEKFDTEEYKSGFEIYDKTYVYGSELKNPFYIVAR